MKTFKTKEEAQAALNARARANVQTTVDTRGYAAPISDADAEFASLVGRMITTRASRTRNCANNSGIANRGYTAKKALASRRIS